MFNLAKYRRLPVQDALPLVDGPHDMSRAHDRLSGLTDLALSSEKANGNPTPSTLSDASLSASRQAGSTLRYSDMAAVKSAAYGDLRETHIDAIQPLVDRVRASFDARITWPVEFRLQQLRRLYWALHDSHDAIVAALWHDLRKPAGESIITETTYCEESILYTCSRLQRWARNESFTDVALPHRFLGPYVRKEPLGPVLILGPFNFPAQLVLMPLIAAIAAGCTAIIKPSEQSPATAALLQRIFEASLDSSCYAVVQGGREPTARLLDLSWGKIFFTGSTRVGNIVATKAAATLTPVALELGGRNTAIVVQGANVTLAAKRILWGRFLNAGQLCLSPNTVLIEESLLHGFLVGANAALRELFPDGAANSPDFARMMTSARFQHARELLARTQGAILVGGDMDPDTGYIAPTLVQCSPDMALKDSLVREEVFGPILTVVPVPDVDSAIALAKRIDATPLALYPFGSADHVARILHQVRSGGATVNDTIMHSGSPNVPFGGLGTSGMGSYRGQAGFECFTHRRTIARTPNWIEPVLWSRYAPFHPAKTRLWHLLIWRDVDFDRSGQRIWTLYRVWDTFWWLFMILLFYWYFAPELTAGVAKWQSR